MKLKNIFLVFVLGTIWGLTSCSSEEMIDTPKNGEVTLSFALSVKDDLTKADPQTRIASDDELTINNCHIAVFDDQEGSESKGNLITSFDFPEGETKLDPNENGDYILSQSASIRTWGKSRKVKVLAIANIDGKENEATPTFENCATYSDYEKAVVASSSFLPNNLVKVGETTLTLENGQSTTIKIELTQLTARIDYVGIQAEGEETTKASSLSSESSIVGIIMKDQELEGEKMKGLIKDNKSKFQDQKDEIGNGANWRDFTDGVYAFGFWKDNRNGDKDNENYQSRFIGVKFEKIVSSSKSDVTELNISGLNNKSIIVTGESSTVANTQNESLGLITVNGNTFYTYEYPKEGTHSLILTVNSSNSGQKVTYGFIRQNYDSQTGTYSPDVASAINDKDIHIYDLSGNRHYGANKFDGLTWTSLTTEGGKTFTLDLSDVTFVRGYRYKILGQYKIGVGIQWEVQSMGSETIGIPSFN